MKKLQNLFKILDKKQLCYLTLFWIMYLSSYTLFPQFSFKLFFFVFSFLFTFFILEGFKISNIKFIKLLQITFTLFVIILLYIFFNLNYTDVIDYIEYKDEKNINNFKNIEFFINSPNEEDKWGLFKSTVKHTVSDNVIESTKQNVEAVSHQIGETISDVSKTLGKSIENAAEKVSDAIVSGSVAGATAYAIKNAKVPPVAKAGLIVGSTLVSSAVSTYTSNMKITKENLPDPIIRPESPSDKIVEQFSINSPFELNSFFGLDPNNAVLNMLFSILVLNSVILFSLYILIIYLIYIYLANRNIELKWIDKILPEKYSLKVKSNIKYFLERWNKSNYVIVILTCILLLITSLCVTYFTYLFYVDFDHLANWYVKYKSLK